MAFFSFSSGKKHPTTRDAVEEGCYRVPLGMYSTFVHTYGRTDCSQSVERKCTVDDAVSYHLHVISASIGVLGYLLADMK